MAAAGSGPGASGPLAALADVSLPPAVPWMPQTPAWAVLGVALLLVALWAAWRAARRYRANRYRREALAQLSLLAQRVDADNAQRTQALAGVAALLKRTALAAWPRETVAASSGEDWARFLELHAGAAKDAAAPLGRIVNDIEYRGTAALASFSSAEARTLVRACREWIAGHRVSA
jgi:Domain of unknown function (DUF4381)